MWMAINGASQQVQPWTMTSAVPVTPATVVTAAVPAPEPANTIPESKPGSQVDTSDSQARELIEVWRQAWAGRDADAYLTNTVRNLRHPTAKTAPTGPKEGNAILQASHQFK